MKYRLLSDIELKELESDFKHFLIANSIYDEEWKKMNQNNDEKVMDLIKMFSEIVFEKALVNVRFLEYVSKDGVNAFFCAKDKMVLIGISSKNGDIDFTKQFPTEFKDDITIFKTSKEYNKKREEEVYELLESGCSIISEEQFKKLELIYNLSVKSSQN